MNTTDGEQYIREIKLRRERVASFDQYPFLMEWGRIYFSGKVESVSRTPPASQLDSEPENHSER